MAKTKPAGKLIKKQSSTLSKNDPRVRAIVVEALDDAFKKLSAQGAERAEKAAKTAAVNESQRKANIEARAKKETKKRKSTNPSSPAWEGLRSLCERYMT
jgi:hypothetical protein